MEDELRKIIRDESNRTADQAVLEGSVEFEMISARESVAKCLVDNGIIPERMRQLATNEE
jgi:hypothetical protein